jgi:hypothetical protein
MGAFDGLPAPGYPRKSVSVSTHLSAYGVACRNNICAGTLIGYVSPRGMKHIAWLLITVFCSATLRVQSVEKEQCTHCVSCHCKVPGDCGMPCSRATTPASSVSALGQRITVASPALRKVAVVHRAAPRFYAPYVEPPTHSVVFTAPVPARAADGPLYMAHCSLLI